MKMSAAESLALETFLNEWDYDLSFNANLIFLTENHPSIKIKESYEHIHEADLGCDILQLATNIQKLIYKELERNK